MKSLFVFLLLALASFNFAEWCYQESVNQSSLCGGLAGGSYWDPNNEWGRNGHTVDLAYDGNWDTYASPIGSEARIIINYTKHPTSVRAIWQTKDDVGVRNITIPDNCFNYFSNNIWLQVLSYDFSTYVSYYCYNGDWIEIHSTELDTLGNFYEEGIFWEIADPINSYCFQEFANETACGGLATGGYNGIRDGVDYWRQDIGGWRSVVDGNWNTYGAHSEVGGPSAPVWVNYSKPLVALNTSRWQVKDSLGTVNLTIPSSCWNYDPSKLYFLIESYYDSTGAWYCWNGGWVILRIGGGAGNIYEEAMWWNLAWTEPPDLIVSLNLNSSINLTNQSGTYYQVSITTLNDATSYLTPVSRTRISYEDTIRDIEIPALGINGSHTTFFWAKCYATQTTLTAQADYFNEVNETDETNNGASITVPPCLPDYKVEVAAVNNSNNVTFEVRTYNAGLGDALSSSYTNDFYYLLELNYVPPLLANQTHIYYRDVMCSPQQNVSFWAYADSTDTVPESNELNNFGNATGTCRDSPDLVVSLGIADTFTNASGTFHEIDATVTNIGIVVSGPSDTLFTYGTANLGTRRVHALFPTQSNSTRITVGCQLEDAIFTARADYYNAVAEASEINNLASITIPHCIPTADLIVSSMQLPQIMLTGRDYEVPVSTRNNGTGLTLPSITRVSIEGIGLAEMSIPSLGTGETFSGTALLYCPSAGKKTVLAAADANGEVMEANEQNNEMQASVTCMNLSIGPRPQPNFTIESIGEGQIKEEEAKGADENSGADGSAGTEGGP